MHAERHSILDLDKLERDSAFLTECLHEVLIECGEEEIAQWLHSLKGERMPERAPQALSILFQLQTMAEENAAAQYRRHTEAREGIGNEPDLWGDSLKELVQEGVKPAALIEGWRKAEVEPVLTAHPTEAKRASVLALHRELYLLLVKRENQMWTPREQKGIRADMKTVLERLWRTGEILIAKPDVLSELRNILYYLRKVFPTALLAQDARFRAQWEAAGLDPSLVASPRCLPAIRFGTWQTDLRCEVVILLLPNVEVLSHLP